MAGTKGHQKNNNIQGETRTSPDPIDIHVGLRVRERRKMLSMSQSSLGDIVGVTFQQIQKYERGTNRIGSSRLLRVANALDVPVSYFFEGAANHLQEPMGADSSLYDLEETQELVSVYYGIQGTFVRKKMMTIIELLGQPRSS
ncbi:helix-turn-helix domain-containing protein [Kordiimonas aquimaris]|uniref:helix-turn-helix domain-containing protein n=1 Tax=Kordiimonas aquimaris TaxID=707591 RepID=UPI0021D06993|nr:helix-turn-helix transcriptional regulator [Kordiimonas aquimaris]